MSMGCPLFTCGELKTQPGAGSAVTWVASICPPPSTFRPISSVHHKNVVVSHGKDFFLTFFFTDAVLEDGINLG